MKVIVALAVFGFAALACAAVLPDIEMLDVLEDTFGAPKCPPPTGLEAILLPNPENCTTYYSCAMGTAWLMPCPAGLHYSAKAKTCDWPHLACCDPAFDPEHKCQ